MQVFFLFFHEAASCSTETCDLFQHYTRLPRVALKEVTYYGTNRASIVAVIGDLF